MSTASEAAEREYPVALPDGDEFVTTRKEIRDLARWAFLAGWDAALEAARDEILDVTKVIDGEEFVFADDVVFDLKSLKHKEDA